MSVKPEISDQDEKPIAFYKEQIYSLKDMMSRTTSYMENLKSELEKKNKEIEQSVSYAKNIQHNLLPQSLAFSRQFSEHYFEVKQRDNIGGDMVYAREVGDAFVFALMDCTGHGIPGALISMLGYTFLDRIVNPANAHSPALVLKGLDLQFRKFFSRGGNKGALNDGMDGIIGSYHKESKSLKYSMAGRPLWYCKKGKWQRHRPSKSAIGGLTNKSFKTNQLSLDEGDEIFLFSDGLPDQFGGPNDKKFLTKRIENFIKKNKNLNLIERFKGLVDEIAEWQGDTEQTDDISLLALKI